MRLKNIRTEYLKFPVSPKTKEIHFKILNEIYPSGELLRVQFNIEQNNCIFCDSEIETTEHLFYQCMYTNTFWEDFVDWLSTKIQLQQDTFTLDNIIFGVILKDSQAEYDLNNLLLLKKYLIHSCKWKKVKPIFSV